MKYLIEFRIEPIWITYFRSYNLIPIPIKAELRDNMA